MSVVSFLILVIKLLYVFNAVYAQYFQNVDLRVYKGDKFVRLINVDTVNDQIEATEIIGEGYSIPIIYAGTFTNLTNLKYLKFENNSIRQLEKGCFWNLPSLRIINFRMNAIENITQDVFNHLTISKLYLSDNGIRRIERNAFHNMKYLEVLDLSRNDLMELQPNMFKNTTNLREIYLNHNKLTFIHEYFFSDAFSNVFKGSKSIIDLSYNEIYFMTRKAFSGVYNVQQLLLNANNIKNLDRDMFQDLRWVEEINLEGNVLKSLHKNILDAWKSAKTINLQWNDWNCDFIKCYAKWAKNRNIENTIDIEC